MKIRKTAIAVMAAGMMITTGTIASAAEVGCGSYTKNIEQMAEKYGITQDEVIHLESNLEQAIDKAEDIESNTDENGRTVKEIPVSQNLVLVVTTEIESEKVQTARTGAERSVYHRRLNSTQELKNILGMSVVTLNSTGVFETNGSTSKPIDAYGTYNAVVWNVTNVNSNMGSPASNAWVRNTFSCQFNIGIDSVSITVQSVTCNCTMYCNAAGTGSVTWG